jgi:hypothetical protein
MKRMRQIMKIATIASAFVIVGGAQEPSEQKKPAAQEMKVPKPGPEMEKTSMIPKGGKSTGWCEARLGPGGLFHHRRF